MKIPPPGQNTGDELLDRADQVVPLLAEHAAETERISRLAPPVAEALRNVDFFTLFAPCRSVSPPSLTTVTEVLARLAHGCGSSAWVSMIMSSAAFLATLFGDVARAEMWQCNPRAAVCGGFGMSGVSQAAHGGIRVRGQWRAVAGLHQAQWAVVETLLPDGAAPGLVLLPTDRATIVESWQTAGIDGHTLVIPETFVPHHRVLPIHALREAGSRWAASSVFATPPMSVLTPTTVAPLIGMAEAATELTLRRLERTEPIDGTIYADAIRSPSVQFDLADSASDVDTAKLHLRRAVEDVETSLSSGSVLSDTVRARIRMDCGVAVTCARRAVRRLVGVNSSSAFGLEQDVQRIWRNMKVAGSHVQISPRMGREMYGRALTGTTPQVSPLV
ncbi:acyl-CoA dehydrogenase family protein [Actinoplanes solisilvae]|uniref:acyl-CoA dehydrogenase family protein n=1 Tax=Actinoplanes solisilvae TaxID=2486853 RepID=UPI0013E39F47|nr:acyl-CoA dehydrogenase family protein [Actinoplanes solisilvae]